MEARELAERLGPRSRRRRKHGRLLVVGAVERGANRAIGVVLHVDMGSEAGEIVVEVVDLLLESGKMRRHLLELTASWSAASSGFALSGSQTQIP